MVMRRKTAQSAWGRREQRRCSRWEVCGLTKDRTWRMCGWVQKGWKKRRTRRNDNLSRNEGYSHEREDGLYGNAKPLIALINLEISQVLSGNLRCSGSVENPILFSVMSALLKFFATLTPPPVNVQEEYDGLQWRWKMFVFRPACMSFCDTCTAGLTSPCLQTLPMRGLWFWRSCSMSCFGGMDRRATSEWQINGVCVCVCVSFFYFNRISTSSQARCPFSSLLPTVQQDRNQVWSTDCRRSLGLFQFLHWSTQYRLASYRVYVPPSSWLASVYRPTRPAGYRFAISACGYVGARFHVDVGCALEWFCFCGRGQGWVGDDQGSSMGLGALFFFCVTKSIRKRELLFFIFLQFRL